ncbi:MAG: hypothetical protein Q4B68_08205 [Bacteroidales bacterium]|nr:hypothetical protein [Bacteroidales bacterium]
MKRLLYFYIILFFSLVSCGDDPVSYTWPDFEWEETSYQTREVRNLPYFVVPQSGGQFTFKCTNYPSFDFDTKLTTYTFAPFEYDTCVSYANWDKKGNVVNITFAPNDTITRYCLCTFGVANAGGILRFVQEGVK